MARATFSLLLVAALAMSGALLAGIAPQAASGLQLRSKGHDHQVAAVGDEIGRTRSVGRRSPGRELEPVLGASASSHVAVRGCHGETIVAGAAMAFAAARDLHSLAVKLQV